MNDVPLGFRTPPHNIEAEQSLLGAILVNNLAYHEVAGIITPDHFYEPVHSRIFAAMKRLITTGRVADVQMLKHTFDADEKLAELNGSEYLARMALSAETIMNARSYAELIADLAGRRALGRVAEEIAAAAYEPSEETSFVEQLGHAQGQMRTLADLAPPDRWKSIGDVANAQIARLRAEDVCWSTGLPTLDNSMAGGIRRGRVYGFEARMKQFKTGSLGSIALSLIRQDCPFLMVLLEMGSLRVFERLMAHETGCNAVRFRKRENPEDLIRRCGTFLDRYSDRRGYFADEPGITFDRLRALCSEAVIKLGVEVVIVDYWQRVRGQAPRQSRVEHLEGISSWFADFCYRENVAGLIASQLNREGESFGSDGLRRDCDWLGLLHKVECHDRMVGDYEGMWIEIAANRDGPDHDLGSADNPSFRIDKLGPVLREYGDWSKVA